MSGAARAGIADSAARSRVRARSIAVFALALIHLPGAANDAMPAEEDARRLGVAALPRVLAHVDADDPDVRVRARALARRIALDHYEAHVPEGLRFVPGRVVVTARDVRCDGFYLGAHEVTLEEFRKFVRADIARWIGTMTAGACSNRVK